MRNSPAERAYLSGDKIIEHEFAEILSLRIRSVQYVKGIAGQQRVLIVKGLDDYTSCYSSYIRKISRPTVTRIKMILPRHMDIKIQFEEKRH